jgi:hypothetical protein
MPEGVRQQVAALLTREAMAVIAGVAAVWAGSHFFGVGEVVDVIFAGAAYIAVGWDAIQALRGFARYYDRAVHARNEADIKAAAQEFATAMITAITAIGWGRLGKWLGKGAGRMVRVENSAAQLARWTRFIEAIEFRVPRDNGMLWSKLGGSANAMAKAQQKGLTCLEMELEKNGFFEIYKREFGGTENAITAEIWKMVSKRYVRSLEGRVTGYVHRASHFKHINESAKTAARAAGVDLKDESAFHQIKKLINPNDPVLVAEEADISELLLTNPKITELQLIDVETGEVFSGRTREIQEWFRLRGQK